MVLINTPFEENLMAYIAAEKKELGLSGDLEKDKKYACHTKGGIILEKF